MAALWLPHSKTHMCVHTAVRLVRGRAVCSSHGTAWVWGSWAWRCSTCTLPLFWVTFRWICCSVTLFCITSQHQHPASGNHCPQRSPNTPCSFPSPGYDVQFPVLISSASWISRTVVTCIIIAEHVRDSTLDPSYSWFRSQFYHLLATWLGVSSLSMLWMLLHL